MFCWVAVSSVIGDEKHKIGDPRILQVECHLFGSSIYHNFLCIIDVDAALHRLAAELAAVEGVPRLTPSPLTSLLRLPKFLFE